VPFRDLPELERHTGRSLQFLHSLRPRNVESMSVVVVTGASGFIGLHLVEALVRRGDRVRCLVRATSQTQKLRELGTELMTLDFQEPRSLAA
jgi:short-subunit dehydrogenase